MEWRRGAREAALRALAKAIGERRDRALLRSYYGEALMRSGRVGLAQDELELAKRLDPGDPSPWLFSALQAYSANEVNSGVRALETSVDLNDERALYRSRRLLDQDRAIRETSLARIYSRAGLEGIGLRGAIAAVASDAASPSAHLYLADAFLALRDPTRFDLRYETSWFQEYLLANLLMPVEAGALAPSLSWQEYSRLLERDGPSLVGETTVRSDGRWQQLATQSATLGRIAYAIDIDYSLHDGEEVNADLHRLEVFPQIKAQVGPYDTAIVLAKVQEYEAGDLRAYRDPSERDPDFRFRETQDPLLVTMWRHEWRPEQQTFAMLGWLKNDQSFEDADAVFNKQVKGLFPDPQGVVADLDYRGQSRFVVGELSHWVLGEKHQIQAGGRFAGGELDTESLVSRSKGDPGSSFEIDRHALDRVSRVGVYGYDTWTPWRPLSVTLGAAWETLEWPRNFRSPPLTPGRQRQEALLPKAGFLWRITDHLSLRGMLGQSMGGVTLDESFRLEPSHVMGFGQAYRTVIPETEIGSVSGHRLNLAGLAFEGRLQEGWYAGVRYRGVRSDIEQDRSVLELDPFRQTWAAVPLAEAIEFVEDEMEVTSDWLIRDHWSLGAGYLFRDTDLASELPDSGFWADEEKSARLHRMAAVARWNHPVGCFARLRFQEYWQASSEGRAHHVPLDWEMGWRFRRQRGEIAVGGLNLLNDDHRLSALSGLQERPRERVFYVRWRFRI